MTSTSGSKCILYFVILINSLRLCLCSEILLISNCVSHSHSTWYNKLATLLVTNGHQVVLLDTDQLKTKVGNITHFLIEDAYNMSSFNFTAEDIENFSEASSSELSNVEIYFSYSYLMCSKFINSKGVKNLMSRYKNHKFDLIILDYYCDSFLGFIPYFGDPPFIIATPFSDPEMVLAKIGLYDNPSYVPTRMFSSFPVQMYFKQRLINLLYYLFLYFKLSFYYVPHEDKNSKSIFGENTPHISDIGRNVSLIMVNTHFAISGAKPLPPAVIPVGGFHIETSQPLPKDIQNFLDGAKNGAILFSFGTNIQPELISKSKVNMYLNVFKSIPQRVIWKFNKTLIEDEIPANVMIKSWLPQSDILAHDRLVAFISHGGLLGTQEAMYFGVPIIGVPFGIDQISNINRISDKGYGIKQSFKYITGESLKQAIIDITTNRSYKDNISELSKILQDRLIHPKDTMLYWIEYVLRHKNHQQYLRSEAANLSIHQLLLLDVLAALSVPIIFIVLLRCFVTKRIFRIFEGKNNQIKEKIN